MAVVPFPKDKDEARLLEPGGALPHSVKLVEPEDKDEDPAQVVKSEELDDGSLQITFGHGDRAEDDDDGDPDDNIGRNLCEDMDDFSLDHIASTLLQEIENDELSRREWEETANMAADYMGIKLQDPTTSVSADGTVCKAVATCMLEAALKMWGVARAELLPVSGPVKVREDDPPEPSDTEEAEAASAEEAFSPTAASAPQAPTSSANGIAAVPLAAPQGGIAAPQPPAPQPSGERDKLGRALEIDMNHYLTVVDKPYYPDTSQMLMNRDVIGMAFKKVYRDPLLRRPVSRWVRAQNLIINNNVSYLGDGTRHTERIPTGQATMRRLMVAGHYRDIVLVHPTARPSNTELSIAAAEGVAAISSLPSDYEHTVYECYCQLGSGTSYSLTGDLARLDRDETGKKPGYPLPYRVSIDVDSRKILEIRRNWKEGDKDHTPRKRYVKFGLIPGFGYYSWGLIHIVGNPTQAATMIQRAMTDSALFANFPGGIYLKGPGSRQANTVIRPNPGEFQGMDAAGAQRIQDVLMPLPYKPPTPEIMALVQKYEGDVRRLSGVVEIPVGEGRLGNTPVGTIMSYIESVSQVPGAVHKDDHIAQQEEFSLLRELFAEDPQALVRGVKRPARKWQIAEEIMSPELVPAADPNTPSEVHRLLKVQGLVTLGGMPQFQGIADNRAIYRFACEALTGERAEEFMTPMQAAPPAPPDPRIMAAQIKAQSDTQKMQLQQQTEQMKHDERMSELASEDQQREADRQSAETRAAMSLEGNKIKAMHDTLNQAADRQQTDQHKQADIQHQQFTAGLTAADNHLNRQAQATQAAQKATQPNQPAQESEE